MLPYEPFVYGLVGTGAIWKPQPFEIIIRYSYSRADSLVISWLPGEVNNIIFILIFVIIIIYLFYFFILFFIFIFIFICFYLYFVFICILFLYS